MHPNSTPCKSHPVGHGSKNKSSSRRWTVSPNVCICPYGSPVRIDDLATAWRICRRAFQGWCSPPRGVEALLAGCDKGPTCVEPTNIDFRPLRAQIDDDARLAHENLRVPSVERRRLARTAGGSDGDGGSVDAQPPKARAVKRPAAAKPSPLEQSLHKAPRRLGAGKALFKRKTAADSAATFLPNRSFDISDALAQANHRNHLTLTLVKTFN